MSHCNSVAHDDDDYADDGELDDCLLCDLRRAMRSGDTFDEFALVTSIETMYLEKRENTKNKSN